MRRGGATLKTDAPKSKVILSIITLNLSGSTLRFAKGVPIIYKEAKLVFGLRITLFFANAGTKLSIIKKNKEKKYCQILLSKEKQHLAIIINKKRTISL